MRYAQSGATELLPQKKHIFFINIFSSRNNILKYKTPPPPGPVSPNIGAILSNFCRLSTSLHEKLMQNIDRYDFTWIMEMRMTIVMFMRMTITMTSFPEKEAKRPHQ